MGALRDGFVLSFAYANYAVRLSVANAYLSGIGVTGPAALTGRSAAWPPRPRVSQIVFLPMKNFTPSRDIYASGGPFCLLVNLINVPHLLYTEDVQLSLQVLLQHLATFSGYHYRVCITLYASDNCAILYAVATGRKRSLPQQHFGGDRI